MCVESVANISYTARVMPRDRCTAFSVGIFRHFPQSSPATILSGIFCLVLLTSVCAQEPVRTYTRQLPIESFRQTPEAFFYLGPFQEVLTGTAGVQYTDNVNLTATNKISDLSFTQELSLNTTWVITHLNQLQFNFGGQIIENQYGNGRSQVNFAIDPNSKIEFKFAISDVQVRIYDQFSYAQNPTQDPTATNTANLNSLTNTIGAVVDTDFNFAVLSLSADYTYNNQSGTNAANQNNPATTGSRESFRAGPTLTFRWSPTILYGVTAQATRSTGENSANVNSLNFGPFIKGKLSRDLEFDLAVGASLVDTKPAIGPDYYFSADLRYMINRHWQLLFSGSHDLVFTTGTDLTEENIFRLGTQLDITRFITLSASPFVNFGDVKSTGGVNSNLNQGSYTQFGVEAGLVWKPHKRWTTALTYDYVRRESGTTSAPGGSSDSYIQNTFAFSISYKF
jgi:opacity protein-like surface antigen